MIHAFRKRVADQAVIGGEQTYPWLPGHWGADRDDGPVNSR